MDDIAATTVVETANVTIPIRHDPLSSPSKGNGLEKDDHHRLDQILKVDFNSLLTTIRDIEDKLSEHNRYDQEPPWAKALMGRLEQLEKFQHEKTPRQGVADSNDNNTVTIATLTLEERILSRVKNEMDMKIGGAALQFDSKITSYSMEMERLHKLLQIRPTSSELQQVVVSMHSLEQKSSAQIEDMQKLLQASIRDKVSEEMEMLMKEVKSSHQMNEESQRLMRKQVHDYSTEIGEIRAGASNTFAAMDKELQNAKEQLAKSTSELDTFKAEMLKTLAEANNTIDSLQNENRKFQQRLAEDKEHTGTVMKQVVDKLANEDLRLEKDLKVVEERVNATHNTMLDMQGELIHYQQRNGVEMKELRLAVKGMEESQQEHTKKMSQLVNIVEEFNAMAFPDKLAKLQDGVGKLNFDVADLKHTIATQLTQELKAVQLKIQVLQEQCNVHIPNMFAEATLRMDQQSDQQKAIQENIELLKMKQQGSDEVLDSLLPLKEQVATLHDARYALEHEIKLLKEAMVSHVDANDEFVRRLEEMEEHMENFEESIADRMGRIRDTLLETLLEKQVETNNAMRQLKEHMELIAMAGDVPGGGGGGRHGAGMRGSRMGSFMMGNSFNAGNMLNAINNSINNGSNAPFVVGGNDNGIDSGALDASDTSAQGTLRTASNAMLRKASAFVKPTIKGALIQGNMIGESGSIASNVSDESMTNNNMNMMGNGQVPGSAGSSRMKMTMRAAGMVVGRLNNAKMLGLGGNRLGRIDSFQGTSDMEESPQQQQQQQQQQQTTTNNPSNFNNTKSMSSNNLMTNKQQPQQQQQQSMMLSQVQESNDQDQEHEDASDNTSLQSSQAPLQKMTSRLSQAVASSVHEPPPGMISRQQSMSAVGTSAPVVAQQSMRFKQPSINNMTVSSVNEDENSVSTTTSNTNNNHNINNNAGMMPMMSNTNTNANNTNNHNANGGGSSPYKLSAVNEDSINDAANNMLSRINSMRTINPMTNNNHSRSMHSVIRSRSPSPPNTMNRNGSVYSPTFNAVVSSRPSSSENAMSGNNSHFGTHSGQNSQGLANEYNQLMQNTNNQREVHFTDESQFVADLCVNFEEVCLRRKRVSTVPIMMCKSVVEVCEGIAEAIALFADAEMVETALEQIQGGPRAVEDVKYDEQFVVTKRTQKVSDFLHQTINLVNMFTNTSMNGSDALTPGVIRYDARNMFMAMVKKGIDMFLTKHNQVLVVGNSRLGRVKLAACIACDRPLVDRVKLDQYVNGSGSSVLETGFHESTASSSGILPPLYNHLDSSSIASRNHTSTSNRPHTSASTNNKNLLSRSTPLLSRKEHALIANSQQNSAASDEGNYVLKAGFKMPRRTPMIAGADGQATRPVFHAK